MNEVDCFPILFCLLQLLSDIQEHLDITIDLVQPDMKVAINEFDGKVTYGQRRKVGGRFKISGSGIRTKPVYIYNSLPDLFHFSKVI